MAAKEAEFSGESLITFPLDMLPNELQNRILYHVPTDDAVRYKAVCKEWQLGIEAWASGASTPMDFTLRSQKPFYFMHNVALPMGSLDTYVYNSDKRKWAPFKMYVPNPEDEKLVPPDPELPHVGRFHFICASGGLVCVINDIKYDTIFVYNPILRDRIRSVRIVPHPREDGWNFALSTDIRSRKYDIALIRSSRVYGVKRTYDMTIHLYKSDTHSWTNLHSERLGNWHIADGCVVCKDVLYGVVQLDCKWSTRPDHAVVAYNLSSQGNSKQKQSLAKTMVHVPCVMTCTKLFSVNDKLILIGHVKNPETFEQSINIWEMCGNGWREITCAPSDRIGHFCKRGHSDFLCSGYGNWILIQDKASSAVLSYEFSSDTWTCLTEPPFPSIADHRKRFGGFCFEPRLDVVP